MNNDPALEGGAPLCKLHDFQAALMQVATTSPASALFKGDAKTN
jgi:hypothetical protein